MRYLGTALKWEATLLCRERRESFAASEPERSGPHPLGLPVWSEGMELAPGHVETGGGTGGLCGPALESPVLSGQ